MLRSSDSHRWALTRYITEAQSAFAAMLWVPFAVVVTVVTFIVDRFGTVESSFWEGASQIPRWYVLAIAIYVVTTHFPLYISSGGTRREFSRHYAAFSVAFGAALAALMTVGFALETLLFRWQGWDQVVEASVLFDTATQYHMVFLGNWLVFLAWTAVVGFVAAAFYGSLMIGGLTVPLGIALISVAELPSSFVFDVLIRFVDVGSLPVLVAVLASLAASGVALLAMRNRLSNVPVGAVSK